MKAKLIVHTGSMFSGKTEGLIRDLKRFTIAKKNIQAFKPAMDNRYGKEIISHSGDKFEAMAIESIGEVMKYLSASTDVIGIEEIQFFALTEKSFKDTINVINALLEMGKVVTVAGLDLTFDGQPFTIVPSLMAMADEVNKYHAVCVNCGEDAWVSWRKTLNKDRVQVGAKDEYEPLCRCCYYKRLRLQK